MRGFIAGAGIAVLTPPLSLHAAGLDDIRVVDAAPEIRPLGAGINRLPNAVRELADLGLQAAVGGSAVPTTELVYSSRHGDVIWREPRGRAAGHRWPQLSVHRGHLQMVLLAAVEERLGGGRVGADARVTDLRLLPTGRVRVTLAHRACSTTTTEADDLIGADGIRSGVRRVLFPGEGPPVWQRQVVWRGIAKIPPFADGRSMFVGGDRTRSSASPMALPEWSRGSWKVIAYPIAPRLDAAGLVDTNWAVARTFVPGELVDRAGWDRVVDPAKLLAALDSWVFDSLDVGALIAAAAPFKQAMLDRDPLPRWTFGPVTLPTRRADGVQRHHPGDHRCPRPGQCRGQPIGHQHRLLGLRTGSARPDDAAPRMQPGTGPGGGGRHGGPAQKGFPHRLVGARPRPGVGRDLSTLRGAGRLRRPDGQRHLLLLGPAPTAPGMTRPAVGRVLNVAGPLTGPRHQTACLSVIEETKDDANR